MVKIPTPSESISLLGCGWLGVALAPALMERGAHVQGSTTQASKLSTLTSLGIESLLLRIEPVLEGESVASDRHSKRFFDSKTLIVNMPPETAMGAEYHPGQLRAILDRRDSDSGFQHLLYVSSTSVYGSTQGMVDESTTPLPDEGSGRILLETEKILAAAALEHGFGLTIVRPAGLIGPGRHPGLFLSGRKDVRDGDGRVNMIHQKDLVSVLAVLATENLPAAGEVRIFNAAARSHPTRRDFYTTMAKAVGVEAPIFLSTNDDRLSVRKQITSEKIREATGVQFLYDDLYSSFGVKPL